MVLRRPSVASRISKEQLQHTKKVREVAAAECRVQREWIVNEVERPVAEGLW